MPTLPSKPALPSLASLADLPDVPSPVLALVGVGDAAAEVARDLKAKLVNVDTSTLDMRDREVRIDLSAFKPEAIDFSKVDPRNIDVSKLDPRNIDAAAVTATGLLWAAKGQERYESLVARGEAVVDQARATESSDAVTDDAAVAQPPAARRQWPRCQWPHLRPRIRPRRPRRRPPPRRPRRPRSIPRPDPDERSITPGIERRRGPSRAFPLQRGGFLAVWGACTAPSRVRCVPAAARPRTVSA